MAPPLTKMQNDLLQNITQVIIKTNNIDNDVDLIIDYAEFGKIICISVGYIHEGSFGEQIRLKSFYNDDEEVLLLEFVKLLEENYKFSILL